MKNKFPLLDIDYPPAMMGVALEVALQVLSGASVPCIYTINTTIVLTHGDETPSIPHPDMYVDQHVVAERCRRHAGVRRHGSRIQSHDLQD